MNTGRRILQAVMLAGLAACSAASQEHRDSIETVVSGTASLPPSRIVSMNPCVDTILRDVAAPDQIAGVSHYSHDPDSTSVPMEWAQRYPAVGDNAEDVLALRPDLVIASSYVPPQTIAALRRMNIPLLQLPLPNTIEESIEQVGFIAHHIGRDEQGRALARRIEKTMRDTHASVDRASPAALVWQEGGLVLGTGTLTDSLLAQAGFRNSAADMHIAQWGVLSLEDILLQPPEIIMSNKAAMANRNGDGGNRLLSHPALRKAEAHIMIADLPARYLHCGGPSIIPAARRLAAIRNAWAERSKGLAKR